MPRPRAHLVSPRHRYCTHCATLMQANTTCPNCNRPHGTALKRQHDSAAWRRISTQALRVTPWCYRCSTTLDLTVHHLAYPARTLDDVIVLCRKHHAEETATPHHT